MVQRHCNGTAHREVTEQRIYYDFTKIFRSVFIDMAISFINVYDSIRENKKLLLGQETLRVTLFYRLGCSTAFSVGGSCCDFLALGTDELLAISKCPIQNFQKKL